jgi:hypothetical protein
MIKIKQQKRSLMRTGEARKTPGKIPTLNMTLPIEWVRDQSIKDKDQVYFELMEDGGLKLSKVKNDSQMSF